MEKFTFVQLAVYHDPLDSETEDMREWTLDVAPAEWHEFRLKVAGHRLVEKMAHVKVFQGLRDLYHALFCVGKTVSEETRKYRARMVDHILRLGVQGLKGKLPLYVDGSGEF
jgi:hypothetical protein